MGKFIAGVKTTLDGFCDHVKTIAEDIDSFIDELSKGKKMDRILRTAD